MRTHFRKRWYLFIPLIFVAIAAFGYVTMWLWNSLLPDLFHLPVITFWQSVGLLVLTRLLFGSHGNPHHHMSGHWRNNLREKWQNMTPEERENFVHHFHNHPHFGKCCDKDSDSGACTSDKNTGSEPK
jgi:hypothetical protein